MGHHNTGHLRVFGKNFVDAIGKREQVLKRDVRTSDVDDLLDLHVGILLDFRHRLDELLSLLSALKALGGLDCFA